MQAAPYGGRAGFGTYNHDTLCVISALVSCGWWAAPAGARLFFRCIFSGGRPDSIKRIFSPRDNQRHLEYWYRRRSPVWQAHVETPSRRSRNRPTTALCQSSCLHDQAGLIRSPKTCSRSSAVGSRSVRSAASIGVSITLPPSVDY